MKRLVFIYAVIPLVIAGCNDDSSTSLLVKSPECTIINQTDLIVPEFGLPKMTFTVENSGKGPTAYNVSVYVELRKGNYIVDESGKSLAHLVRGNLNLETFSLLKLKAEMNAIGQKFCFTGMTHREVTTIETG